MGRKTREQIAAEQAVKDAEFNAKVDSAVNERVEAMFAQIQSRLGATAPAAAPTGEGGTAQLLSDLVTNLKKLADPNGAKRIFSPEEMRQMESGRDDMVRLILTAHENGTPPVYSLRDKVYLNERLVEPQYQDPHTKRMMWQEIEWPNVPNEAMVPVNDTAREIYAAFKRSIANTISNENRRSSFVRMGSLVLRGMTSEPAQTGHAQTHDPRIKLQPVDYDAPLNVLGTVAKPASPVAGAKFGAGQPASQLGRAV